MEWCELCEVEKATTTVEYRDLNYEVCERCKALAEVEG
jgi:ribosomal protein L40E